MSTQLHRFKATLLLNRFLVEDHYLLRLKAEEWTAQVSAKPGHFVHISCGEGTLLPRPFSLLDVDQDRGTLDILYKVVGQGSRLMRDWQTGDSVTMMGPIGKPFSLPKKGEKALLISGGVGLAPLDFLARTLRKEDIEAVLLFGTESDPPFETVGVEDPTQKGMLLAFSHLKELGIVSRMASLRKREGFFQGFVTELAEDFLMQQKDARYRIYTCGPTVMMAAVAKLAEKMGLYYGEASLEEHMACGFGGCAGCVAPIKEKQGWYYRRVCVDGPVFDLDRVLW
ncbi:dihydroorotate dehydrogenase electron transfer subunit [Magnetococcales bacterium HHB-1]